MTKSSGRFKQIGEEIGSLVEEKNAAYGNSFGKVAEFLKILWPDGIPVEAYTDALCTVRMFDKLMRIANKKDAFGESPYRDIAGYSILGVEKDERETFDAKAWLLADKKAGINPHYANFTKDITDDDIAVEDTKRYMYEKATQELLDIQASKLFFSPGQVKRFEAQKSANQNEVSSEEKPVVDKKKEPRDLMGKLYQVFDEIIETHQKNGPFLPVTIWVRNEYEASRSRHGHISDYAITDLRVNHYRETPAGMLPDARPSGTLRPGKVYCNEKSGQPRTIDISDITLVYHGDVLVWDGRVLHKLRGQLLDKDALNNILENDEELKLRATLQKEADERDHFKEDEESKKLDNIGKIDKWIKENTKNPDSNVIEVWKPIHKYFAHVEGALKAGDVVKFFNDKDDHSNEGLRIEEIVGSMAIVSHDSWSAPVRIDLSATRDLKKKITIEFANEQERNNWFEILKSSSASMDEVIDKFVQKQKLQTDLLVESNAKQQNHNIVSTMEVDDGDCESVCTDHDAANDVGL